MCLLVMLSVSCGKEEESELINSSSSGSPLPSPSVDCGGSSCMD